MPPQCLTTIYRQLLGIGQIAIVRHTYAMGEIRVERLRLGTRARTGGGISDMSKTDIAPEFYHMMRAEDILHETIVLA